jgi:hypothetical protein
MRRSLAAAVATLAVALAPAEPRAEDAAPTGVPAAATQAEAVPTPAAPSAPDATPAPDAKPIPAATTASTQPLTPVPVATADTPGPNPDLTPEAAAQQAAASDADARDAAAAGLPVPESSRRAGAEAKATLAQQHRGLRRSLPIIGIAVGGGFPDLGTLSLLVRPVSSIRLFGGPTWGWVGWGLHGGVVLVPVNWAITPTLSFETGKLFRSNLSFLLGDDGDAAKMKPILRGVDYQYVAADVGLELGNPSGFAFTLRLGLSWVTVKGNGSATFDGDSGARVTFSNPTVRATLPSFKTGFQYWF